MISSSFKVWLHPRRAFADLEDTRRRLTESEQELQRVSEESRSRNDELTLLRNEMVAKEREARRIAAELSEMSVKCGEQAEALCRWEEKSARIEREAAELDKLHAMRDMMEGMRREYEERIAKLERQLWSSRSGGLQYTDPAMDNPEPWESELLEPGESPFLPPAPIAVGGGRPKVLPAADETDWLLPLPD